MGICGSVNGHLADVHGSKNGSQGVRYEMGKLLGKGNYSEVKKAVIKATGQSVAIKCVQKAGLNQEDEQALKEEVRILRAMNHPNVIKLEDFYEDEMSYFIVMEMAQGGELFDKIVEKECYSESDAQKVSHTTSTYITHHTNLQLCLLCSGGENFDRGSCVSSRA